MKTKDERRRTKAAALLPFILHPSSFILSLCCLLLLAACGAASPPAPTATPIIAPAPTSAPTALGAVPDLRGKTPVEAAELLTPLGLKLGTERSSCTEIGATPIDPAGLAGIILCQSIPPGSMAPAGLTIDYVLNTTR